MIDILIPTYNRSEFLKKNLFILDNQISKNKLSGYFRILVSDNRSADDTWDNLQSLEGRINCKLVLYRQEKNIGLEPNAIFLLKKADADYVMYLGDDDYLPDGYLDFVVDIVQKENASCVIPGISALHPDGTITVSRQAPFPIKRFEPGLSSVCKVSHFAHQLSGVVTSRKGLYEEYTKESKNRNIYPFVFFVGYNAFNGVTYYAPKFKVLVSIGNEKDWNYDDSGLLTEIYKNYNILFPRSPWKKFQCCVVFTYRQNWRLRVGRNPFLTGKALAHIFKNPSVNVPFKWFLPFLTIFIYGTSVLRKLGVAGNRG